MSYDDVDGLDDQFRNTVVTIEFDGTDLVIDPLAAPYELPWERPVHVITAWNPGMHASAEDNAHSNLALEQILLDRSLRYFPAVGRARDGRWEEWGFAVVGADRDDALELGRRHLQLAIFELTSLGLVVLTC
jgi:hypothetical protein